MCTCVPPRPGPRASPSASDNLHAGGGVLVRAPGPRKSRMPVGTPAARRFRATGSPQRSGHWPCAPGTIKCNSAARVTPTQSHMPLAVATWQPQRHVTLTARPGWDSVQVQIPPTGRESGLASYLPRRFPAKSGITGNGIRDFGSAPNRCPGGTPRAGAAGLGFELINGPLS